MWRPDGKALYYLNPAGEMMAAPITAAGGAPDGSIRELAQQPHLAHLSDSVLNEYEEDADSAG